MIETPVLVLITALAFVGEVRAQIAPELSHCVVEGFDRLGAKDVPEGDATQVVAGGGAEGWLVVWFEGSPAAMLRGARIALDGTLLDPDGFDIASTQLEGSYPAVAWGEDAWLVIWSEGVHEQRPLTAVGQTDLLAVRVDADGHTLDETPVIVAANPAFYEMWVRAAWRDGAWLIVWPEIHPDYFALNNDRLDGHDIRGLRMAGTGQVLDTTPLHIAARPTTNAEGGPDLPIHLSAGESGWLVTFAHYTDDYERSTRGTRVAEAGVLDPEPVALSSSRGAVTVAVAASGGGWLLLNDLWSGQPQDSEQSEIIRFEPDASGPERLLSLPHEATRSAQLVATDSRMLLTWSIEVAAGGASLHAWTAPTEASEFAAADTFVIASEPLTGHVDHSLVADGRGQGLLIGGRFSATPLRIDVQEGAVCGMNVGPGPAEPDGRMAQDAAVAPDADASTNQRDAAPAPRSRDRGDSNAEPAAPTARSDSRSSDGCHCQIAIAARGGNFGPGLLWLLGAVAAWRLRRRGAARARGRSGFEF